MTTAWLVKTSKELSVAVFPLRPNAKIPATASGFKEAKPHDQIPDAWRTALNYGIATGLVSNITVLDFDGLEGLEQLVKLSELCGYDLAKYTYAVKTPNDGIHLYFKYIPSIRTTVKLASGLDIRNDGGYVVGEGSEIDGVVYEAVYCPTNEPIKPMPAKLGEYLLSLYTKPLQPKASSSSSSSSQLVSDDKLVPVGGRNHYLTQLGGAMRRKGMGPEAIEAALMVENETRLEEPLHPDEVGRIAKSVGRYSPEDDAAVSAIETGEASELVKASSFFSSMTSYLKNKDLVKGSPTGLDGLDKLLGGGKRLGEVTCWHAEAKTGKNTLWHYLMYLQLEAGIGQAYASRELSPDTEVVPNLMSVAFGENAWLEDITEERERLYKEKLDKWPLYFSQGYGYFGLSTIRLWLEQGIAAGVQYFWFDHLHYMLEDPEDHKAASKLIKDLKTLAKQLNIHIDIIIQPNKLSDGQKLSLNSIKGGAAMGQAIDNLLILERVKGASNISRLTLEVGRSKLCSPGSIYLAFDKHTTRFVETEAEEESQAGYGAAFGLSAPSPSQPSDYTVGAKFAEKLIKKSYAAQRS